MIAGMRERFAIEAEVEEHIDGFVLGHVRFWIGGRAVGNWEDSVDLLGCVRWLRDFRDNPRNRYEPGLWHLPAAELFHLLYDPVMSGMKSPPQLHVPDAYARFHVSHLGMSSTERFDMLLLKDEEGAERCLWREAATEEIHECYLENFEMESVAGEICEQIERTISGTR